MEVVTVSVLLWDICDVFSQWPCIQLVLNSGVTQFVLHQQSSWRWQQVSGGSGCAVLSVSLSIPPGLSGLGLLIYPMWGILCLENGVAPPTTDSWHNPITEPMSRIQMKMKIKLSFPCMGEEKTGKGKQSEEKGEGQSRPPSVFQYHTVFSFSQ